MELEEVIKMKVSHFEQENPEDMSLSDFSNQEAPGYKTKLRHEFARSIIRGAGLPTDDKNELLNHNLKHI